MLDVLLITAILSPIIPLFFLAIIREKNYGPKLVSLGALLLANLSSDAISFYCAEKGISTFFIFHVYTIFAGVFIYFIYKYEIVNKYIKRSFLWATLVFVILSLYYLVFQNGLSQYNSEPYTILSTLVIVLSVYYFYELFIKLEIPYLTKHYFFWVNSAFLIYFASTFFLTVFENFLIQPGVELDLVLWPIQHAATIIFNLIIAKGIWTMKTA